MHSSALPHRRFQTHRDPAAAERALQDAEAAALAERDQLSARREALYLAGRLVVASVFLVSAVVKAASYDGANADMLGTVFWVSVVLELALFGIVPSAVSQAGIVVTCAGVAMVAWKTARRA